MTKTTSDDKKCCEGNQKGDMRQENSLNPRGGGCSEITPLYSSLGDRVRLHHTQKKINKYSPLTSCCVVQFLTDHRPSPRGSGIPA